jgi:hypothetical protein
VYGFIFSFFVAFIINRMPFFVAVSNYLPHSLLLYKIHLTFIIHISKTQSFLCMGRILNHGRILLQFFFWILRARPVVSHIKILFVYCTFFIFNMFARLTDTHRRPTNTGKSDVIDVIIFWFFFSSSHSTNALFLFVY